MSSKSEQKTLLQKIGIALFVLGLGIFLASLTMSRFELNTEALKESINDDYHWSFVQKQVVELEGKEFSSSFTFVPALKKALEGAQVEVKRDVEEVQGLSSTGGNEYWNAIMQDYKIQDALFPVTKASAKGFLPDNTWLIFLLSIGLGIVGAGFYMLPKLRQLSGIKNNHIYHSSMHYLGALGIATGIYLISFYVLLYFYPEHLVNWVILVDPISEAISGNPASQWFLYGFLYTLCILVMGIRMIIKYRHNKYHIIRTISVMFFQLAFAFLIPEILVALNQPYYDLKNIWPLDYDFFFDFQLNTFLTSGAVGLFMLVWGIALIFLAVPLFSHFFGKRWYCSWVCGCGGLAETLGDPYRQLSDKSLKAWQAERWIVHGVLAFAVVMTILVLYTFFTGASRVLIFDSFQIRSWYGFLIGAGFAGVVGTGFYPLMGNRVWCRFGCPLAAYLGLVQRFKSRFRITTNGGQCISCGNCSTYCEMGIDVRWYAQRGQDVVRASCVGCGVCAAVCPRGVLRLENSGEDVNQRTKQLRTIHVSEDQVLRLSMDGQ